MLYGDVSPSGRLPYTIAHALDDYPPNTIIKDDVPAPQSDFTESTLIDYRWFTAHNITPRFEFGFGLSYSVFNYSGIYVQDVYEADNTTVQKTNEQFEGSDGSNSLYDVIAEVTAQVTNTGDVLACEVAQLVRPSGYESACDRPLPRAPQYVTFPESEGVWLRGFDKLKQVNPGETRTATFLLRRKDLSLWSTERQLWYTPEGEIELQVGASSTKLYLVRFLFSIIAWVFSDAALLADYCVVTVDGLHNGACNGFDRRDETKCDAYLYTILRIRVIPIPLVHCVVI